MAFLQLFNLKAFSSPQLSSKDMISQASLSTFPMPYIIGNLTSLFDIYPLEYMKMASFIPFAHAHRKIFLLHTQSLFSHVVQSSASFPSKSSSKRILKIFSSSVLLSAGHRKSQLQTQRTCFCRLCISFLTLCW